MLRRLQEVYSHSNYQCQFEVNPQGERCNDVRRHPDCRGFQPYITISTQVDKIRLTAIIIADCDECRRTSINPYVKSSTDLDLVLKASISGVGELCRRERQGDYFFFEELRYITCEVCRKTWHMPRTVHDESDNDGEAMEKRSAKNADRIQREMMTEGHHCELISTLDAALSDFNDSISGIKFPGKYDDWRIYDNIPIYLKWRFIGKDEPYPFEEIYDKLILLLLARKHDKGSLISWLPKEILKMILLLAKEPWMNT